MFKRQQQISEPRRGSTLIIVLALLGLLSLLGVVFFMLASQERENAEIFLEAAKETSPDVDDGINHFLRNIMVGPRARNHNSVMAGGRHTLVGNLVGDDALPNSGDSINIVYNANNVPEPDLDRNGVGDGSPPRANNPVDFVDYLGAHGGTTRPLAQFPQPDSGYTYPDVNNLFISYVADVPWIENGTARTIKVVIPSFMRPQLLRTESAAANGPVTEDDWYEDPDLVARIMRPHPNHLYITPEGRTLDPGGVAIRRFIHPTDPSDATARGLLPGGSGGFPFEPPDIAETGFRGELGVWTMDAGRLASLTTAQKEALLNRIELDVDNDGDGRPDSHWMDLGFPAQDDPDPTSGGAKYTLLYAPMIIDLDGLLNLNIHGNLAHLVGSSDHAGLPLDASNGRHEFLSASNTGLSPAEVNPSWALMRDISAGDFTKYAAWYGNAPDNAYEQANMDLMWLLAGRADLDNGTVTDIFAGRWGDADRLYQVATQLAASGNPNPFGLVGGFPKPGIAGADDDNNVAEGSFGFGPLGMSHPLDYTGAGAFYSAGNARIANMINGPGSMPVMQYRSQRDANMVLSLPSLLGYQLFSESNSVGAVNTGPNQHILWGADGTRGTADDLILPETVDVNNPLFDGPMESVVEPDEVRRPADEPFTYADAFEMQITAAEAMNAAEEISQRVSTLAPHAFEGPTGRENRQRFTTHSNSLKHRTFRSPLGPDGKFGTADDTARAWEYNADRSLPQGNINNPQRQPEPNGLREFPPQYGDAIPFSSRKIGIDGDVTDGNNQGALRNYAQQGEDNSISEDPFRPQVRRMLRSEVGDVKALFGQRLLSLNHLLDIERLPNRFADVLRGTLEYRQLTEHPIGLGGNGAEDSAVLGLTSSDVPKDSPTAGPANVPFPPVTVAQQEYWARRDRQEMARDIFVLLYTIGGGNDSTDYSQSNLRIAGSAMPSVVPGSSYRLYSEAQLRQMAQFAVNVVDALDRDDVITKFEYDKNLGNTLGDSGVLRSGWNLDDNPYTDDPTAWTNGDPDSPTATAAYDQDTAERGVVYGVEKQKLTISESLGIQILEPAGTPSPDPRLYDNGETLHLFVELQNVDTLDVPLATSAMSNGSQANWRLRQVYFDTGGVAQNGTTVEFGPNAGAISPSSPFVVAASNQTDSQRSADVYLDTNADGTTYRSIAPAVAVDAASTTPAPLCALDLGHTDHRGRFALNGGPILSGGGQENAMFQNDIFDDMNTGRETRFAIVLERRQNLGLPQMDVGENEWIEVDRMFVDFQRLNVEPVAPTTINDVIDGIRSTDRLQALSVRNASEAAAGFDGFRNNLTRLSHSYTRWQTHFDRDFTSVGELLNIPLVGPRSLALEYGRSQAAPWALGGSGTTQVEYVGSIDLPPDYPTGGTNQPDAESDDHELLFAPVLQNPIESGYVQGGMVPGANGRFLLPDYPDGEIGDLDGRSENDFDNRWYRLFGFMQIPTRTHRMLGNVIEYGRVPGKINLNMLRHREVFAGLMDEQQIGDMLLAADGVTDLTTDRGDWWLRFLQSRDPRRFIGTEDGFHLPGLPGSRPFHGFDRVARENAGDDEAVRLDMEDTLLRRDFVDVDGDLLDDGDGNNMRMGRRLFELSNDSSYASLNFPSGQPKTGLMKHRLLSKMMNNSSTGSNVFMVILTIGHFETLVDSNGAVRIGGEYDINHDGTLDDADRRKVMFIIDRSDILDAYDPGTGQLDWQSLVKEQVVIQ